MNAHLPPERTLSDKESRVATILRDEAPSARRWLIPIAAAASVALVGGGVYAVSTAGSGGQDDGAGPATGKPSATRAVPKKPKSPATVDILDRELTGSELATFTARCLEAATGPAMAAHGKGVTFEPAEIAYAWNLVNSTVPDSPAELYMVVEDRQSDSTFYCSGIRNEGQIPAADQLASFPFRGPLALKSTTNQTDPTHPAIPTDGGGGIGGWAEDDDQPDGVSASASLYIVDDRVAVMRQRLYVKGQQPGPWLTSAAHGGYAVVLASLAPRPLHAGDKVVLETQVLDAQGNLLDAPGDQVGGGGISPSPGTTRVDTFVMRPGPLDSLTFELE